MCCAPFLALASTKSNGISLFTILLCEVYNVICKSWSKCSRCGPIFPVLGHRFLLQTLLLLTLVCCGCGQRILGAVQHEETKVMEVAGVTGSPAELPCPLSPYTPGDRPKLVLWYRRGATKPVISYDGRAPRLSPPMSAELSNPHLTVSRVSASLSYPHLSLMLAGLYECRVDFFRSPTHVNLVNLTVIEPPTSVSIIDNQAGSSLSGMLGPYAEGSRLMLTCLVRGGSPRPSVHWTRDGKEVTIQQADNHDEHKIVRSDLILASLPRSWHNSNVSCTAANSNLTAPIVTTATVHMYLSASSVVVQGPASTVAGQLARLQCWARGATPPASLEWAINGQPLHPHSRENSIPDGVSTSVVEIRVSPADNKAVMSCTARNTAVATLLHPTNTTRLVVYYPPTVSVEFGLSIELRRLKEGDDVYLRCKVAANPAPDKILWFHDGKIQEPNRTRGIIMSGDSLALQKVDRHMAGQYRCAAANHLANATSRPLALKLAYKPVCMMASTTTYFIYDQPINVTCHVASHPPASRIDWYWNSGNDIISLQPTSSVPEMLTRRPPPTAADWDRSWARLSVRPSKHQEDRQLSCWANNAMGRQETPCRFFIRVAKTPAPVTSCRLANITASSVSLTCSRPPHPQPGTAQYFAEVYEEDGNLLANLSSARPWFNVSQLDPGTAYKLKVYVAHGPIASVPVVVSAYTSNTPLQQPSRPTTSTGYGYRGSLVATAIIGLLCLIGIMVAVFRRLTLPSVSARNSLNKNMASASSMSPMNKSTANLADGEDETSEIRGAASSAAEQDDIAGFETRPTCAVTSKSQTPSDEILEFSGSRTTGREIEFEGEMTPSCKTSIAETNLSEHQIMLPKGESFFTHRESPDGRKDDRYGEASPSLADFSIFSRASEGWTNVVSEELSSSSQYREVMDALKNTR